MAGLFSFAKTNVGKTLFGIVLIGAIVFSIIQMKGIFGKSQAQAIGNDRIFMDRESGKTYHVDLSELVGKPFPVYCPISGKNTGYPAEFCYWTKEGTLKQEPTAVILNSFLGIPGPTFCPDCGRLVVPHNSPGHPGATPPPTREEYLARHGAPKN